MPTFLLGIEQYSNRRRFLQRVSWVLLQLTQEAK